MIHILKKFIRYSFYCITSIIFYLLLSILISYIPVNNTTTTIEDTQTIYIHTNGVHLSLILPIENIFESLLKDLNIKNTNYVQFGWGDKGFYLNVATWNDFKIKYGLQAFLLDKPTLVHVKTIKNQKESWIAIKATPKEIFKLNTFLEASFKVNETGNKITIPQNIYTNNEVLYEANGSYSPINTCNTWVNSNLKQSGIKASYWTIFDFGLLNKHK